MKRPVCPRCGLEVAGPQQHENAEDCLRHLAPRYQFAQKSVAHMHQRYRLLEERMERANIALRLARKDAKRFERLANRNLNQSATIPARLEAVEAALKQIRKEQDLAA